MVLILKRWTGVEDLTVGCTFGGTGGGGPKDIGLAMLYPHIDAGGTIGIVDVNSTLKAEGENAGICVVIAHQDSR